VPFDESNFIQETTGGSSNTTSHVVTLPSGTTAGNAVVVLFTVSIGFSVTPTGFSPLSTVVPTVAYIKTEVAAGETSWTFTTPSATAMQWYVAEISNVDPVAPLDVSAVAQNDNVVDGGTATTGTTGQNTNLGVLALAWFGSSDPGNTNALDSFTNGFEELYDLSGGGTPGTPTAYAGLVVARRFHEGTTGTFSTTGTVHTSLPTTSMDGCVVVIRSNDSPDVGAVTALAGFEWGTHGGGGQQSLGSGGSDDEPNGIFGGATWPRAAWDTEYLIQAGSARDTGYGLRVNGGAVGTHFVVIGNFAATKTVTMGFNCRVVSAIANTFPVAAAANTLGSQRATIWYDGVNNKFGVQLNAGTVSWQDGTTALNTWVWLEVRVKVNTSTWYAEWRIETGADTYAEQAPVTLTGQATNATITDLWVGTGSLSISTAGVTVDYDDVACAATWSAYPFGPVKVRLVKVDPAGTPSVSGSTANFNTFSANGTLAAWNATTARNALDEVPPTVSASADGVVQVAVAASDYMEFPMDTVTLAADEAVAGVRMISCHWGGTGSGTGTLGIRGHDGTTETVLFDTSLSYDAGSPTAISVSAPYWRCKLWPSAGGWTQAKLNAAVLRVGYSTDATPDMGVSAIYLEVAIRKAKLARQIEVTDGSDVFTVDLNLNPESSATASYIVTVPTGRSATFGYTLLGTPVSETVLAVNSPKTYTIQADAYGDVSDVTLRPEPL
jgi:hypothetical protein